jgi:outer membrane protein assembly factor BamB
LRIRFLAVLGIAACGNTPQENPPAPAADAGDEAVRSPDAALDAETDVGTDADRSEATTVPSADVLMQHNDAFRTGANLGENVLTTSNVAGLHELFRVLVDGQIYAQPLYAHGVAVEAGTSNLLFVATMEDSIYAFDADVGGAPIWRRHLGTPALSSRNIGGDNGILSTPVIDRSTETMYLVVRDCDPSHAPDAPSCAHVLFALDLRDGSTLRSVIVSGQATSDAGAVSFDPDTHWNRAGLALAGGRVYIAFTAGPNGGQHEEDFVYHGWVFGYAADRFDTPPTVHSTTPHAKAGGGIWQSGNGLAADGDDIFFATGNSIIGATTHPPAIFPVRPRDEENSVVKLSHATGAEISSVYYDDRPYHADGNVFQYMESNDIDFASSGPILIPGTRRLVATGKSGIVYTLDRDTMKPVQDPLSAFTNPPLPPDQTLYVFSWAVGPQVLGGPVFWKPDAVDVGWVYIWPATDKLKALPFDYATQTLSAAAPLEASLPITPKGGQLSLSAAGGRRGTGVLWASSSPRADGAGHLWALHAETLDVLWEIDVPHYAKFVPPTVAAGRVFVASSAPGTADANGVIVMGL